MFQNRAILAQGLKRQDYKQKGVKMLVLSRFRNQSIIIGDDIKVKILDVRENKVQLGIEAPKNISVHRQEVYEAIQREKTRQNGKQETAIP